MKAFRFSLQAILTLREEREQEAQRHYARRLRAAEAVDAELATVGRHLTALATEQQARLQTGLAASELERLGQYRSVLEERRVRLQQDLARARQAAELARGALVQATQARQALDNYRQKLHRLYDQTLARDEQKLLDELAGRRAALAGAWRSAPETLAP
jgi:flagellar FliJ protein